MPNVLQTPISKPDNVLAARSSFGLNLKLTDDFYASYSQNTDCKTRFWFD